MTAADVPDYPGVKVAHTAIHMVIDDNAVGLHDRVRIGLCPKIGRHSRLCDVRMVGETPLRLRVYVSKVAAGVYKVHGSIIEGAS